MCKCTPRISIILHALLRQQLDMNLPVAYLLCVQGGAVYVSGGSSDSGGGLLTISSSVLSNNDNAEDIYKMWAYETGMGVSTAHLNSVETWPSAMHSTSPLHCCSRREALSVWWHVLLCACYIDVWPPSWDIKSAGCCRW